MKTTRIDAPRPDGSLQHLRTAVIFTVVTVVLLGLVYPAVMTGIALVAFPSQANGSLVTVNGKVVGSDIIGQLFTKPQYFHGRPSAAGKDGYDPTATGGTNLGPTSKKLIDATKATIAALKKENPDATEPVPMDLSDLERQRHRSRHQSGRGLLPGVARGQRTAPRRGAGACAHRCAHPCAGNGFPRRAARQCLGTERRPRSSAVAKNLSRSLSC